MTENNLPVKSTGKELVRYNVGLAKYTNSLIFTLNKDELFKEAINCFKQKNYHEAYLKFYRIYQYYPVSKGLYPYLAYCAFEIGNKDKIEFFLWKAFELKVVDMNNENRKILNDKQWSLLLIELSFSESIENLLIKIYLNLILKNNDAAEKNWNRIMEGELSGKDFWYYYLLGDINFTKEKYLEALENFSIAITFDPNNSIVYCKRGIAKQWLKDSLGAIKDFNKAIELDPTQSTFYVSRGFARNELQDNFNAIEDYNMAINLGSIDAYTFSNRGWAKFELGDYSGAINDFDKAIELDPNDEIAYYSLGCTKIDLENYLESIEDFNKAIQLNSTSSESYIQRGIAKYKIKDYLGAIEDYTKAIELEPNDPFAYHNRGAVYEQIGDIETYKKDWEKYTLLIKNYVIY